jgi:hypothetical protein
VLFHPRASDGQAAVEWLGIVALVAVLLALGAALAQAGYVGRQVTREMARALCRVGQGDCERDQDPCVVRAEHGRSSMVLSAFVVRLGSGGEALLEQRSDGSVAVTHIRSGTFGLAGAVGGKLKVKAKGIDVAVGGEVQATLLGRREGGRTWIVRSWSEAQRLLGGLRVLGGGPSRPPDIAYGGRTLESAAGASVGADGLVHLDLAHGDLRFDRTAGARLDRRTGRRTISVRSSLHGGLTAGGGVLGLSGSAGAADETYAVELDAGGRPVDLQVAVAGAFEGSRDLPDVLQPVAGLLAAGRADGRVFEVTAHLDLTDAGNLTAARELLDALAHRGWAGAVTQASQALRRRLDERGSVEARVLEQKASAEDLDVHGALGVQVGAAIHADRAATRLVAAASRGLDGQWVPRTDCVAGASA